MADVQHGGLTLSNGVGGINGIHVGQNYVFASEGAQNAQVVGAGDVGKFAFRTDQNEMWAAVTAGTGIENWRMITADTEAAASSSLDTTTSSTFQDKVSATLQPINATWLVSGSALISHSNVTGTPSLRLRETSVGVDLLTRDYQIEVNAVSNVPSAFLVSTILTTTLDSPTKVVSLQFAVIAGTGTMSISDAAVRAVVTS